MTLPGTVTAINSHACMAAVIVDQEHEIRDLRAALEALILGLRAAAELRNPGDEINVDALVSPAETVLSKPRP